MGADVDRDMLAEQYMPLVHSVVSSMVGARRGFVDYEEAFSEALVGYAVAVLRYTPAKGDFSAFARRVIRCQLVSLLRKEGGRRESERERRKSVFLVGEIPDTPYSLDASWIDFSAFLRTLAPEERVMLTLLAQGFSQQEAARVLGCSQTRVSRMLSKVHRRWRMEVSA